VATKAYCSYSQRARKRAAVRRLRATEPFDFDTEYDNALKSDLAPGLSVRFVSIQALIIMKEAAGRPRDLDHIQHLRWILNEIKEMNRTDDDIDWSLTTWEGSRRAQLRHWLAFTVRERLQAIEDLAEVAARIARFTATE